MTDYNDGKWHGWNGGECPVHPRTQVTVKLENPANESGDMIGAAQSWVWDQKGGAKIVAFRVTKEHKEPREFWLAPLGGYYASKERANAAADQICGPLIHVREVLEDSE